MAWGENFEGTAGLGFALTNANAMGSGVVVYSWALLVFSRENGLNIGLVFQNIDDIVQSIRENEESWLLEHNIPVLLSWVRMDYPQTPYCLKADWHRAWMRILDDEFSWPVIYQRDSQKDLYLSAPDSGNLALEAGKIFSSQSYAD